LIAAIARAGVNPREMRLKAVCMREKMHNVASGASDQELMIVRNTRTLLGEDVPGIDRERS